MPKFSERLKSLRKEFNLSQQELANQLGCISKSSVNMYERGEREPGLETLEAIADYFNVDMDYLLGKSNTPNRYKDFMDSILEETKSGRTAAKDAMYKSFGSKHRASDCQMCEGKIAILYYRAFDRHNALEFQRIIDTVEDLDYSALENIRILIQAYLSVDKNFKAIVDTTLASRAEEIRAAEDLI